MLFLFSDLRQENAMLWPKLEWYQRIEAKELGESFSGMYKYKILSYKSAQVI